MRTRVTILARPRVHIALADLGHFTQRAYGGIGFAFNGPPNVWDLRKSSSLLLVGLEKLDATAQRDIQRLSEKIVDRNRGVGFEATLISTSPQHYGFGSKTALLLGLAAGVNHLFDLGATPDELRRICGRGGASGTGSHTFFEGGVIWDGGHPRDPTRSLAPSSAGSPANPPPRIARWDFPEPWRIAAFAPEDPQFSGAAELQFFSDNTPLPADEVAATLGALYHAVAPGFALANLELLRQGLHILHTTGFKARALRRRPPRTQDFISHVSEELRLPVGVSSIGPMVYVVLPFEDAVKVSELDAAAGRFGAPRLGIYAGWNRGFDLTDG